jgi:Ca-activated chloride channel family protein
MLFCASPTCASGAANWRRAAACRCTCEKTVKFLWPETLWLLFAVPVLVAVYVVLLRRRKKVALRYASLTIVKEAMGAGQSLRRHVPPLLILLALTTMFVAVGRPVAVVTLPSQHETVILAMDVSGSMRATDVQPNRLAASQAAAKAFIAEQPLTTRIGVVAFAATASLVQTPTRNREDIIASIDRFQLQRGTAIGSGIIVSLATLLPNAGIDVSKLLYGRDAWRRTPLDKTREPEKKDFKPAPPGSYNSGAIILLTDGQRTTGPDSLEAARMAADRGVRVFTVGVGTKDGETIGFEGWSMRVRLDEETLKNIANLTHGEYFYAGTATDLVKVYKTLNSRLVLEKKETEITALLSAAAAVLVLLAAALSLLWFNRIV